MTFISPISTIAIECAGNVLPNAVLLADVDITKSNKLLVGTQEGELLIFKADRNQSDAKLWRRAQGMGFVTAVAVGPLVTSGTETPPVICVANAEGAIHLFLLRVSTQRNRVRSAGGTIASNSRTDSKLQLYGAGTISNDDEQLIQPVFSQQLICNPKALIIAEWNENEKQLAIAYNDRTIRIFVSTLVEDYDGRLSGRISYKSVISTGDQIHTLTSRRLSARDYELIASQPGGNLFRCNPNEDNFLPHTTDTTNLTKNTWTEAIALDSFQDDVVYATICHDHIDIFSNLLNQKIGCVQLNVTAGHLCGLRKGPIAKDNYNQLVTVSSIDGDTFIVDRHHNVIRFRPPLSSNTVLGSGADAATHGNFIDQIQAFTAGYFGDINMFCFIYVLTHNDKIIIVHSLEISNSRTDNLLTVLSKKKLNEKFNQDEPISEQLKDILHPHY